MIYRTHIHVNNNINFPVTNKQKHENFTKEGIQLVNKYVKKIFNLDYEQRNINENANEISHYIY